MKKVISVIIVLASFVVSASAMDRNFREERRFNNYNGLSVSDGIQLIVTDAVTNMVIEASSNILSYIVTTATNGVLDISLSPRYTRPQRMPTIIVYVPVHQYIYVNATRGAMVTFPSSFRGGNMQMKASGGAVINLPKGFQANKLDLHSDNGGMIKGDFKGDKVNASVGGGSSIRVKGETKEVNVKANNGSSAQMGGLKSQNANSEASSGSRVKVNASNEFSGQASNGSSVSNKGKAPNSQQGSASGSGRQKSQGSTSSSNRTSSQRNR